MDHHACLVYFGPAKISVVHPNSTGVTAHLRAQECVLINDTQFSGQPYTFVAGDAAIFSKFVDFLNKVPFQCMLIAFLLYSACGEGCVGHTH